MKSIVELIQYRITPMEKEKNEKNITRVFHRDDYKSLYAVIASLEEGEKCKKILEELSEVEIRRDDDCSKIWFRIEKEKEFKDFEGIYEIVNYIKQKYFPKEKNENG